MDKALNYLALARKAGLAELGEEPVNAATRALKAPLVVVAADASDHTWRQALSFVSGTDQQCLRLPFSKDELGQMVGRSSLAIAALTDPALALSLVKALPVQERYDGVLKSLENRVEKVRQWEKEAKNRLRNKRTGKKRRPAPTKEH